MLDKKIKPKLSKQQLEKRRKYMREYYQNKRLGKTSQKKNKEECSFSIKYGKFFVYFE